MITVTICQSSEGEITGFSIQGHAGYAERGSDIVCAAVSVLAQNTVNSIEQFTQDSFSADVDEENGGLYLKMEPIKTASGFPYPRFTGDRRRIYGLSRCHIRGGVRHVKDEPSVICS